jgi:predicted DNA-binding transcriptional regulator AlpA
MFSFDIIHERDLAGWLGVSQSTLAKWFRDGTGPIPTRLTARRRFYRTDAVEAWLESRDILDT